MEVNDISRCNEMSWNLKGDVDQILPSLNGECYRVDSVDKGKLFDKLFAR